MLLWTVCSGLRCGRPWLLTLTSIAAGRTVGDWRGLNLWPLGYSTGSPNQQAPGDFSFPSPLSPLCSAFAVCIHSIRDFWGEKQSIFHLHKPQFNKWDSCFMQLIWWQSEGIRRSNKWLCWEKRRGCGLLCVLQTCGRTSTRTNFSGRKSAHSRERKTHPAPLPPQQRGGNLPLPRQHKDSSRQVIAYF